MEFGGFFPRQVYCISLEQASILLERGRWPFWDIVSAALKSFMGEFVTEMGKGSPTPQQSIAVTTHFSLFT